MTNRTRTSCSLACAAALALALPVRAQGPQAVSPAPTAAEIIERSQAAFTTSPGADMVVKVKLDLVTEGGQKKTRLLTMLRRNDPGGKDQRYFLYFHEPGDVRGTALLVWKYPEREDDRWIFIPAVSMVRRIAARDSRSSFVGSDFTYEDVSGRDLAADDHRLVREEKLGDVDCFVVESVPKGAAEHTRKLSWIDRTSWLPLREEYYDARDELSRMFTADRVDEVAGAGDGGAQRDPTAERKTVPVVTRRTMKNVKNGHVTVVEFESVAYDVGLEESIFTERSLTSPPLKWIR